MNRLQQTFCVEKVHSKRLRSAFLPIICILSSCLIMLVYGLLYAADTDVKLCLLKFNQVTFSDFVRQIGDNTVIEVFTNQFPENELFNWPQQYEVGIFLPNWRRLREGMGSTVGER